MSTALSIVPEPEERGITPIQGMAGRLDQGAWLAGELKRIIATNGLARRLGGKKDHVDVEGWLTIARCLNEQPHAKVESTWKDEGGFQVIHARAWVTDAAGSIVSEADAYCSSEEANWKGKPFYARASMAQTRALGKALRLRHAWIMVMAGFEATPSEEMVDLETKKEAKPTKTYKLKPDAPAPAPAPAKAEEVPTVIPEKPEAEEGVESVVATVLNVSQKSGEKNGKAWKLFGIHLETQEGEKFWANTFDTTLAAKAEVAHSDRLTIVADIKRTEFNGKPKTDLVGLNVASGGVA